jgi:hypothetical protein
MGWTERVWLMSENKQTKAGWLAGKREAINSWRLVGWLDTVQVADSDDATFTAEPSNEMSLSVISRDCSIELP